MRGTTKAMLIGGAAALGVPALANALIHARRGQLSSPLEGERMVYPWKHGDIVYYVAGEGEPLLLVHGVSIGSSSYEWKENFAALAKDFKVYTLDMLGFGESGKPSVHYDGRLYIDLLTDFVIDVIDEPTEIIASSHGAAFTIAAAKKHKLLIRKLVLVCPTGMEQLAGWPSIPGTALFLAMSAPVLGKSMYYSLASRGNIERTLKWAIYHDSSFVTQEMVDHYYTASHQPGADRAAKAFISGMLNLNVHTAFSRLDQPTLLVWGREAKMSPLKYADAFLQANPGAQLQIVENCGILPHSERSEEFNTLVRDWLKSPEEQSAISSQQPAAGE